MELTTSKRSAEENLHPIPWHSWFNKSALDGNLASRMLPGRVHLLVSVTALVLAAAYGYWRLGLLAGCSFVALVSASPEVADYQSRMFPWIGYLQFPWRFLSIFNLFSSASAAMLVSSVGFLRHRACIVAVCASVLLPSYYSSLVPAQGWLEFDTSTIEGLRSSGTTLDHEDKYMPVNAVKIVAARTAYLRADEGEVAFSLSKQALNRYEFRVHVTERASLRFNQYWFPGWRLEVDGQFREIVRDRDSGLCRFDLRKGDSLVKISFDATPMYRIARLGAKVGGCCLLLAVLLDRWRKGAT